MDPRAATQTDPVFAFYTSSGFRSFTQTQKHVRVSHLKWFSPGAGLKFGYKSKANAFGPCPLVLSLLCHFVAATEAPPCFNPQILKLPPPRCFFSFVCCFYFSFFVHGSCATMSYLTWVPPFLNLQI